MDGRIDWISYTVRCESEPRTPQQVFYIAKNMTERIDNEIAATVFRGTDFEPKVGRPPYRFALVSDSTGVRVYGGSTTNTVLIEISGRGCDVFSAQEFARRAVRSLGSRITRFDYAIDVRTGVLPSEFTRKRNKNAFRSKSIIRSDSGETVYLGSPKSDRFARVYRYNPPHPRAALLRVEFVFRRGMAKSASRYYASKEAQCDFIGACGTTFGLKHQAWQPTVLTDEKVPTPERSEKAGKTVSWLYSQVAPALSRVMAEDAINLTDWLEHVYSL